jgi:signal transduction histidine kinase
VALGGLGSLAVGAALGMGASEIAQLGASLIPAGAVTVAAIALTAPMLARSTLRVRFLVIAVTATVVALANLLALTHLMAVEAHDATLVGALLLYATGAGTGAAWIAGRTATASLDRIAATARRLREGDLSARVGEVRGGPELERLAATLDAMAARQLEAQEREQRLEAVRRDLITAVSHDLRTPLASLRAMIEAIDEGVVADPPTLRRYLPQMRRSAGQLSLLVDDLFELVQVDAGAIEAEEARLRLDDVVRSALATVEHDARAKQLRLSADLGDAVALPCSPRIARVLQTLLVNAIRHTPAEGSVRVEARRSDLGLELAVEDDGEGIPAADLPRIFEPFYRVDAARSGGGAGLGLALAERIVEALGGRIEARRMPRGARFEVVLPLG